ncbi:MULTISPECIES: DUF3040 domain-containing protein [unclassified Streptomyces]|uniref:DUF3040 domain-containing protein n=1 Tax=unclassified Streptomyces TaxID=2593676 RepID=UPI0007ECAD51|nr:MULTISPECIES: DUF3040 domain-containing protein [unclassified Streptomyces]MCP3767914.1 DUF3040 domain-containing protein [Streptomyces sp. MAR25Y5]OBQ53201.1 hypothetical protein A4U61_03040 [Streptomyces sp. H-KF8]
MTTGPLRDDEQDILAETERVLRRDRRFDRRMRTLARHRRPLSARSARCRPRPWTVAVPLAVSVALMAAGIETSEPAVIWAFAALWPLTLYSMFRLLCRWTEP